MLLVMNFALIITCLFYTALSSRIVDSRIDSSWSRHKSEHRLDFGPIEDEERMGIFLDNLKFIEDFNSKNTGVVLAMNKFGHLRATEIGYGLKITENEPPVEVLEKFATEIPLEKSKDWRNYSVVTEVKDQGSCGSCYAFSAVGAIESHHALKYGILENFSAQEIVDCSTETPDSGCDGGLPDSVFEYAMKDGLCLESDYPYTARASTCKAESKSHSSKVSSYLDIPRYNERELVRVLSSVGPVSIAIDGDHREFRFYKSGVLDIKDCSQTNLNHGVLAVGFNAQSEPPYLIVKNSWGSYWGDHGYFKIVLYKNMCGVSTKASYPVIMREE